MIISLATHARSSYAIVFYIWLCVTLLNINKAFHIDDTFHIEAALHIMDDPMHPMSGEINWDNNQKKIYKSNHPPLFFYAVAFFIKLFGTSEVALHLLLSIFVFLALHYFYRILVLLQIRSTAFFILVFAFCPAFIVNQNLMVDIPILSFLLGMAYHLHKSIDKSKWINYTLAAGLISLAVLMKYAIIPAFVLLALIILIRRDYKYLVVILIPFLTIVLWSGWNLIEFDGIHIISRWQRPYDPNQLWAFLACFGSVIFITNVLLLRLLKKLTIAVITHTIMVVSVIGLLMSYANIVSEAFISVLLNIGFLTNGILLLALGIYLFAREVKTYNSTSYLRSNQFINWLFLGSFAFFLVRYAPFAATRHILLILPFFLLAIAPSIDHYNYGIRNVILCFHILIGVILGISDWHYADYYRTIAKQIELPTDGKVWHAGHWGWQWYAKELGEQYSTNSSDLKVGDYIIFPKDIPAQKLNEKYETSVVKKYWQEATVFTYFSGKDFASLYNSFLNKPPWKLSSLPVDTIVISRVHAVKE